MSQSVHWSTLIVSLLLTISISGDFVLASRTKNHTTTTVLSRPCGSGTGISKKNLASVPQAPVVPRVQGVPASDVNFDTLKHVQILFRHGDRSPLFDFPKNAVNISEKWPLGFGQLTSQGKVRAHDLGLFLRKRYGGFVSKEFHPKEIYIQSSNFDRTIMSALSVLSGLYLTAGKSWDSAINWDPVPLRTISCDQDNIFSFAKPCPAYKAELEKLVKHGKGKAFDDQHKKLYDLIANHTGLSNITFATISELYDTLFIQHLNGFPLPDWAAKSLPGQEPFVMKRIAEYTFSVLTSTPILMKLRGGPILREMIKNIEAYKSYVKSNGTDQVHRKIILHSAHDTTVSTLLQALGVFEPHLVPYSSAVIIELHKPALEVPSSPVNPCLNASSLTKSSISDDDYYIKVVYRNCTKKSPMELFIPNCGGLSETLHKNSTNTTTSSNDTMPGVCKLTQFLKLKKELLKGNWHTDCFSGLSSGSHHCSCADSTALLCPGGFKNPTSNLFENFLRLCKSVFVTSVSDACTCIAEAAGGCSWTGLLDFFNSLIPDLCSLWPKKTNLKYKGCCNTR